MAVRKQPRGGSTFVFFKNCKRGAQHRFRLKGDCCRRDPINEFNPEIEAVYMLHVFFFKHANVMR
jgi:hypothetical protein